MKYLIQRMDEGGGFVTPSQSESTYTADPLKARRFVNREQAERCRCKENQIIVLLEDAVQR